MSISEPNSEDLLAAESLGIAATRDQERMLAAKGKMELCEKDLEWNNVKLREIRKKSNSHQTSIVTTNNISRNKPETKL